tara:strand:- start:1512 stop:1658 length:147 start_codon:yes stop_codon:yes gene_type:complete
VKKLFEKKKIKKIIKKVKRDIKKKKNVSQIRGNQFKKKKLNQKEKLNK